MAGPGLYTIFEYLATLIAERTPEEPFLLSQIQPAIRYKFPDFTFSDYQLPGMKEFLQAGDKAGFFKLVNTGNIQTAYLAPGAKVAQPSVDTAKAAGDPRRKQWMTLAKENMILAERADQLVDAMRHVEALSPEFDAFLAAEGKAARIYPVRGKLQRIRAFLRTCREQSEGQAIVNWKVSRAVLRIPSVPAVKTAAAAQSLIWALLQGNMQLDGLPVESLDNLFFAVLIYCREQLERNNAWDWVAGMNILEAEARAIPRPAPPPPKRGLFGGKTQPIPAPNALDESEIASLVALLHSAAGSGPAQNTQTWQAFARTADPAAAYRFLADNPKLLEDEDLVNWLEDQINQNVASGAMDIVRNLASKSALLIVARQFGLSAVPQQTEDIKRIYDSVMEGARQLHILFGFLDAPTLPAAADYFKQHGELADVDAVAPLFDDQTLKAAHGDDLNRYRRVTDRADLWRNLAEFGVEEGLRQHERYMASPRSDPTIQAEVGIMLLVEAKTPEASQDVIGRYPPVATKEALAMLDRTLDVLSFQNADLDQYNRYHDVKRLIERCLQIGVDRALAELK